MLLRKSPSLESTIRSSDITPQHVFEHHSSADPPPLPHRSRHPRRSRRRRPHHPPLIHPANNRPRRRSAKTVPSKYTARRRRRPLSPRPPTTTTFTSSAPTSPTPRTTPTRLNTRPWPVQITGMVKKPQTINIDDLIHYRPLESRVYRHRCVEAWSMVIPWDGYSLSEFINFCEPLPSAKYVQFFSYVDRKQMPDLPSGYDWPYKRRPAHGRGHEPAHPSHLRLLRPGPAQPERRSRPRHRALEVRLQDPQSPSSASTSPTSSPTPPGTKPTASEYGFYSNVNPNYDNARWSQAHERRIDSSLLPRTIPTQMFNGYSDQVASLYAGMDLKKIY